MQQILSEEELLRKVDEQEHLIEVLRGQVEEAKSLLRNEKISHIKSVSDFEVEEEKAANALLRRLDLLNKEKNKILQEMEKEEEFMANALIKKLEKVRNHSFRCADDPVAGRENQDRARARTRGGIHHEQTAGPNEGTECRERVCWLIHPF